MTQLHDQRCMSSLVEKPLTWQRKGKTVDCTWSGGGNELDTALAVGNLHKGSSKQEVRRIESHARRDACLITVVATSSSAATLA